MIEDYDDFSLVKYS